MPSADHRTFDRLFAEGQQTLLDGTYMRESPPADGSRRWGIAAALRPDPAAAHAIEQAATTAAAIIGDHCWLAGAVSRSHLTLRAGLEPYRSTVPPADPLVTRYSAALRTAAAGAGPLRFTITGLTLTPISVMACATPVDAAADDLARAFSAALSTQGCDAGTTPGIWYLNLAYYTGPVRDPRALISWVRARRQTKIADVLVTSVQLVHWHHTPAGMTPTVLASATPPARARREGERPRRAHEPGAAPAP